MRAANLKPKHVEGLVERWKVEGLAVGTIKNRTAELQWWAANSRAVQLRGRYDPK